MISYPGLEMDPQLIGREAVLRQAEILLGRIKIGRSEKSLLITGFRGVGKTALLIEIQKKAEELGYRTIFLEAHEDKSLAPLLAPHLCTIFYNSIGDKARRALSMLKGELGFADSGDIEIDLPELLMAVGEAASNNSPVAILIDEIHNLPRKDFGALIMAMHRLQQRLLPVLLIGAGSPMLPRLAGESKPYAERLFNFPNL